MWSQVYLKNSSMYENPVRLEYGLYLLTSLNKGLVSRRIADEKSKIKSDPKISFLHENL